MGLFTPLDVLIGVKAYIGEQECLSFDVQDDGRLIFRPKENDLFRFCLHKEVRMITNDGSNWGLGDWKVWLQDHIKYVPFFQYSVKIGRRILGARSWKEPIANGF